MQLNIEVKQMGEFTSKDSEDVITIWMSKEKILSDEKKGNGWEKESHLPSKPKWIFRDLKRSQFSLFKDFEG